jgi:hypothetical protein
MTYNITRGRPATGSGDGAGTGGRIVAMELQEQDAAVTPADAGLETLAREAMALPGAGAALLHAFAAHARAVRLVLEADALGAAALPAEVRARLQGAAATTPHWLA